MKSSFFSQSSLCVYIYCDLSSCAQSVAFICWGKKRRRSAKSMPEARSVEVCFGAQKQKKHTPPRISLFTSLFDSFLRSFAPQNWSVFFPFFAYSKKTSFRTRNSSFLKHRIHPKHGSGRTSSLTRSNTRKCVVVVLLCLLLCRVLLYTRKTLVVVFSLCVVVKKKKSQTLGLSSVRGRNAPPCFV